MGFHILVVDDEATIRNSLSRLLVTNGYSVGLADCAQAALSEAKKRRPDLVLLDIRLPDRSGLEVLRQLKQMNLRLAVIVMTAYGSTREAVLAMKGGAYDYLSKPFDIAAIRLLIKKALATRKTRPRRGAADAAPWQGSACERLISASPAMKPLLDLLDRLPAHSGSNVLIEGETGTGKELVAHAIHEMDGESQGPFVAVSCGAIPRELLESELLGYEKGAFTGARPEGKQGLFEQAGDGTIFLDEIGELDWNLQVKLLRVLEEREFCRVGGLRTISLRARLIAATNRHLKQEVERGRFRADLYYRLNVVQITVPPLRERRGDIVPLAESFLREFKERFGKNLSAISPGARQLMESYAWPGNVRELRNVMERIVLLESGDTILPEHLPGELLNPGPPSRDLSAGADGAPGPRLQRVEKDCIAQALEDTGGNVVKTARLLGLKRGALRYRMAKYGL